MTSKDIRELEVPSDGRRDFADITMSECLCGSTLWQILAAFHENKVAAYYEQMKCAVCGAWALAPLDLEKPDEV